jgi:hypothetical protein
MIYGIDSETVDHLHIFQENKELKWNTEVYCGKTMVTFSVKPKKWFGMIYQRSAFAKDDKGIWDYNDHWYVRFGTLFMLMLPAYSVVLSLNAKELKRNKFDLESHPVMSQHFSGGNLDVRLKYTIDSQQYLADRPRALERSSFPRQPLTLLSSNQPSLSSVRSAIAKSVNALDWIARGSVIIQVLKTLGLM